MSSNPDMYNTGIKRVYKPVGYCIYCGTDEGPLTDEHTLPDGLAGRHVLPQSSCKACQKIINEEFEQYCMRSLLANARSKFQLKSRKKRPSPPSSILVRRNDGEIEKLYMGAEDLPLVVQLPTLPPPTILLGMPPPDAVVGTIWTFGIPAAIKQLGVSGIELQEIDFQAFARFLAKIAYSMGIAAFGPGQFESPLPDIILGRRAHCNEYVGGTGTERTPPDPGNVFAMISLLVDRVSDGQTFASTKIRLFPNLGGPEYLVVLGTLLKPWPV